MEQLKKHPLKTSVHKSLAVRLTLAGLIISFAFGLTVFLIERGKVGEAVINHSLRARELFNARNRQLLDVPGLTNSEEIQTELETFLEDSEKLKIGHTVFIRIYNLDRVKVAEIIDKDYASINAVTNLMDSSGHSSPLTEEASHDIIRIEGAAHVKVTVPLTNSDGALVGFVAAVFVPSAETIAAMRLKAIRTMFATVFVVLLTTALLYPIISRLTDKLATLSVRLLDANLETLETLGSAIALRDSDTNAHNYRVTIISVRIAEALGLSPQTIQTLIKGAFLHDVGKIGISDEILLKPGRLTEDEFHVMKKHVRYGQDIVKRSAWLKDALEVVGYHHEKVDGSGYDTGAVGEDIPVTARVFAIADVFDALTSRRPYKEPFSFEKSMSILAEGRGSHFDPVFLDAFTEIARPLYDRLSGNDEEQVKELEEIIVQYFDSESGSMG